MKGVSKLIFALLAFSAFLEPDNSFAFGENYDELGFKKNKTYLKFSPEEYVNVFSGNLLLTHTDLILPGNGGFDLKLQRTYNSKLFADFTIINNPTISGLTLGSLGLGWDMHFGRISDYGLTVVNNPNEFFLQMPDGSIHQIYNNDHPNITSHISSTYITEDFWIIDYDPATDGYTMTLPDGTEYTFSRRVTNWFSYSFLYVTSIRDKNGNEIAIEYYDCCNMTNNDPDTGIIGTCPDPSNALTSTRHIKKVTDSVGREINFTMLNTMCRGNAISSIDANGNVYNYLYFPGDDRPSTPWLHWDGGSGRALAEVQPPEGPSWQYFYDVDPNDSEPDGELISVTYSSGGVAQYDYETVVLDLLNSPSATMPFQFRMLASRTASGPDITSGTWMFDYDPINTQDITTVTDSCGNKEIYKFFGLRAGSFNGGWSIGLLNNKEVRDSVNFIFEADNNMWTPYQISNDGTDPIAETAGIFLPLLDGETITRDGRNFITDFTYNTFYDSPTQIAETGEISRTTDITYFEDLSAGNYIIGKPLVTTVTVDTESKTLTNTYDISGNLLSEDNFGVLTEFSYHPDGNLEWQRNARGFYTHFDQYSFGVAGRIRLGSSDDLASDPTILESKTINWEGTISSFTNGRGHTTSYTYDGLNRLTSITPPPSGEAQTTIEYDNLNARSMILRKSDSAVQHFLDGFGRPIGTLSTTSVQTEIDYDACGRKVYESFPFDIFTPNVGESFTYDPLGRMKSMTHPDNTKIDLSYSGNSVTVKNERNVNTTLNYASFGDPDEKRLSSVLDADNNTTSYEYDLLGNITRVDSPQGNDRIFTYNSKNFLISENHPESGTTMFDHDEIGNVTSKTNADGSSIGFQYDRLNRLTLVDDLSGEDDVILDYDGASNRTLMESGSASYSYAFQYDQSNRLTRQDVNIGGVSYSVDFVYDGENNLIQSIYPSGEVVDYNYDADGRILHIPPVAGNFAYHASGAPVHFDNEIGVSSDFTYDNRSRLKTLQVSRTFPYLLVTKEGLGNGMVTSNPLGIDCGSDCALVSGAEGTEVALTATPDQDSNFVSWGGDPDCTEGMVTMIGTKVCIATFALKANQETLTITKDGSGTGTVTSSPPGIDCGSDCTENYEVNTEVTLTANPDAGFSLNGWSGDPDCSDGMVTMDASKTCNATFGTQQFTLTLTKTGGGFGTVTSAPAGIDCGGDCTELYDENTQVTLTATPGAGSILGNWSGDCDVNGMVSMDSDKACVATFISGSTLTIQKNGTGTGTVTSNPGGIDCGTDCSEVFATPQLIQITAIAGPGSEFVGWSGPPGCPTGPVSQILFESDLACTATFDLLPSNQYSLNVTKVGAGRVTSNPLGINCGGDCAEIYNEGTSVTLTPNADAGWVFADWSGDPDCSDGNVLMDGNKTCNATFNTSSQQFTLTVDIFGFGRVIAFNGALPAGVDCRKVGILGPVSGSDCSETLPVSTDLTFEINTLSTCPPGFMQFCTNPEVDYNSTFIKWAGDPDCLDGVVELGSNKTCIGIFTPYLLTLSTSGSGTASRSPSGNTCTSHADCDKYYEPGTVVDLTAIPNAGNYFSGWTGGPDCSDSALIMDEKKSCTANFGVLLPNSFALTVLKSGAGKGSVTSLDTGIDCGPDCNEVYSENTVVTLAPNADPGSVFVGWSGGTDCSGSVVTMDASKICTAQFDLLFDLTQPAVYVANNAADSLSVIDPITQTEVASVPGVGDGPNGIVVTPDGTRVYITNFSDDTISVLNTENLNLLDTFASGDGPHFPAISSDGSRLYVPNRNANSVSIIETLNNTLVDSVTVGNFPFGVAIDPLGTDVYVSNTSSDNVSVIDSSTNSVIATIIVGDGPRQIAVSPDGTRAYVANWGSDTVSIIDTISNTVVDTVNVGNGPYGVAFSPDGANVYITHDLDVFMSVIETATNTVVDTISLSSSLGVAISDDGTNLYVTNDIDDTVTVIETLSNTIVQTIGVGDKPTGIAFRPGNDPSPPQQHTLSVTKNGSGTGTVTSNPVGIDCGVDCTEDYDEDTFVTLTASPDPGSTFAGWAGDPDCTDGVVRVTAAKSCTANFNVPQFTLSINKTGTGSGAVTSSPAGINCGPDCTEDYNSGTAVNLTATPSPGSIFVGWSGNPDCSNMVTMDTDKNCTATFDIETFTLTVNKTGTGNGTLTSSPAGIDCGSDCTEDYVGGTNVTITATPDPGSTFDGGSGDCDVNGMVTMDAAKSCTATFSTSAQLFTLSVSKSGTGTGNVTSSPGGIDCGIDCAEDYAINSQVTLNPSPDVASAFVAWSGDPDCSDGLVLMDAAKSCIAIFDQACDCSAPNAILGTSGNDTLTGSNGPDIICGFDGDDTLNGQGGDDCIYGGAGADTINGGRGLDELYGGTEDDIIVGDRDGDLLDGGPGTDNLDGGSGTDTCVNGETLLNCEISQIQHPLSVSKTGTGSGTVTSTPTGINCGGDCSENYDDGTSVTLAAAPDAGSTFDGWSRDCDVNGMVTIDAPKSCTGTFTTSSQLFTLTVNLSGTGTGIVTSNAPGIDCGIDCTEDYLVGTQVTLTPNPDTGSTFTGWSGDADCSDGMVTMDANKICSAAFDIQSQDPCNCNDPNAMLGTSGNDTLTGTAQSDIICGFDGDDTLIGLGGNDCLFGGAGNDTMQGDNGSDNIFGGDDNDIIQGGKGNDLLDGGNGTDDLDGGSNTDTCLNGETNSNCEQFGGLQKIISTLTELRDII
ncbi:MAG: InlB B-repeat-containing protein [Thermodesulfobacteriota bacterium]